MTIATTRIDTRTSEYELAESALHRHFAEFSQLAPQNEVCENLSLFITPQHFRRMIFFCEMYKMILDKPGSILQFGVRWGRELALFENLRTLYEPFNHSRRIVGFDTFTGYAGISPEDGNSKQFTEGNLSVTADYNQFLHCVLRNRESFSPVPNAQKFQLVSGDVTHTLETYLEDHPHELVSMLHLDLNLYQPTLFVLERIWERVFKGTLVIIDEINCPAIPGETLALREFLNLKEVGLKRLPGSSPTWPAYFIVE
jgi:hypothetical protein